MNDQIENENENEIEVLVINEASAGQLDKHQRTVILFDDDIFVPPETSGNCLDVVSQKAKTEAIELFDHEGHSYAPLSWLENAFKEQRSLYAVIREKVSSRKQESETSFFE